MSQDSKCINMCIFCFLYYLVYFSLCWFAVVVVIFVVIVADDVYIIHVVILFTVIHFWRWILIPGNTRIPSIHLLSVGRYSFKCLSKKKGTSAERIRVRCDAIVMSFRFKVANSHRYLLHCPHIVQRSYINIHTKRHTYTYT